MKHAFLRVLKASRSAVALACMVLFIGGHSWAETVDANADAAANDPLMTLLADAARHERWQWANDDATHVSWHTVLDKAKENHPLVLQAKSRLAETEAKQDGVESKRVLFFFKYFDARYLEGSAELDVKAAHAQVDAARQQALRQTAGDYLALVNATEGHALAQSRWQLAISELNKARHDFDAGTITGLELNESVHDVLAKKQAMLAAQVERAHACRPLLLLLDKDPKGACRIDDVTLRSKDVPQLTDDWDALEKSMVRQLPTHWAFQEWTPELPAESVLRKSVSQRPDVQAMQFRVEALEKLAKASSVKLDKEQLLVLKASTESAQLRHAQMNNDARAQLEDALLASALNASSVETGQMLLALAAKNLHQTRVSVAAGFQSALDEQAALIAYVQAHQAWVQTLARQAQARLDVLAASGLLTYERLK